MVVDRGSVPNLFNYLGFDGQHVVFSVIPAGSNSNQLEIQQRNPDGEIVTVFSSGDPIPPDDGIAYTTRGEDLRIHDGVVYMSLTGPGGLRGRGRINFHTILARIENQTPDGDPFVLTGAAEKRGYPIPGGPLFFQLREEPDSAGD